MMHDDVRFARMSDAASELDGRSPPVLASSPRILDEVTQTLSRLGVAGEHHNVQLIYLVIVTRLFDRIVSLAVKGASSSGKSRLVDSVLRLFPPTAYHALSSFSERALIYDDAPLAHRMLVIYEAAGIAGEQQSYIVRSLLSEGRVSYLTVEKGKGGLGPRRIDREGPTGLITTTTAERLHPENETRLLSITISDSPEQTRAILRAYARGIDPSVDLGPWHELQGWLEQGSTAVSIPWLETLAEAIPPVTVRLRRDFPAVVALIQAHALLHQRSRERDEAGAVVATFEDYAVVRRLVADLVTEAAERAVPDSVRETVERVGALASGGSETTVLAVAQSLGIDKSSASRRVRSAIDRGYVKNLEERRGRALRLVVGDPLPTQQTILPEPADLERLHGCSVVDGGSPSDRVAAAGGQGDGADAVMRATPRSGRSTELPNATDIPSDDLATVQPPLPMYTMGMRDDDGLGPPTEDLKADAEAAFAELGGQWTSLLPDDDHGASDETEEHPWS